MLPRSPPSYIVSKVEETESLPPSSLLEDPALIRSQIVGPESHLKISGIETMLQPAAPGYVAAEGTGEPGAAVVIPKSEDATLLPSVALMDQPTGTALGLVYGHPPPPPYPSGDLQNETYKVRMTVISFSYHHQRVM